MAYYRIISRDIITNITYHIEKFKWFHYEKGGVWGPSKFYLWKWVDISKTFMEYKEALAELDGIKICRSSPKIDVCYKESF